MIPKIIHYCWLSNDPVPQDMQRYISSWHKFLPDYEFVKWDFSRFDINSSIWVKEAFEHRKYAFAADYIRIYALYTMGGIYLDMDVEVLGSFDKFLNLSTMICWQNGSDGLEVAAFGAEKGALWLRDCLNYYSDRHFILSDGKFELLPLPNLVEKILKDNAYNFISVNDCKFEMKSGDKDFYVLPSDFFSPKSYIDGKMNITSNTVCIHHYAGSWIPYHKRLFYNTKRKLGIGNTGIIIFLNKLSSIIKFR